MVYIMDPDFWGLKNLIIPAGWVSYFLSYIMCYANVKGNVII